MTSKTIKYSENTFKKEKFTNSSFFLGSCKYYSIHLKIQMVRALYFKMTRRIFVLLKMIYSWKLIYVLLNFRALRMNFKNHSRLSSFQLGLRDNCTNKIVTLNLYEIVLRTITSRLVLQWSRCLKMIKGRNFRSLWSLIGYVNVVNVQKQSKRTLICSFSCTHGTLWCI